MRRCSVVLSVLVAVVWGGASASAGEPPPPGEPMCSYARTTGPVLPAVDTGDYCVWGYPYGQWCENQYTWSDGIGEIWVDVCYPGLI